MGPQEPTQSMYCRLSASKMREPCPCSMKGGVPPTPLNARTGELTPPGMTSCARWKRESEFLPMRSAIIAARSAASRHRSGSTFHCLFTWISRRAATVSRMKNIVVIISAALLFACGGGESRQPVRASAGESSDAVTINGAGATFPYPLYSKWFADYETQHPDVRINYQSIGSGGGIRQLTAGTVFFGASDSPMNAEQLQAAGGNVLHFPTTLGAVVPVYNLPGVASLNFTPDVLADIFLGKVTKWNDPRLSKANTGAALPELPIVVVHRSDGSGTTFIFCDYLSKVSPAFRSAVGASTSVQWPVGVGAKGNEGVAGLVRQTPGAIGYVELVYALQNKIAYGAVQNLAGEWVRASNET